MIGINIFHIFLCAVVALCFLLLSSCISLYFLLFPSLSLPLGSLFCFVLLIYLRNVIFFFLCCENRNLLLFFLLSSYSHFYCSQFIFVSNNNNSSSRSSGEGERNVFAHLKKTRKSGRV